MHILYCTFGNRFQNHLQAAFSAISFLQQPSEISSINIITDAPSFYKHLAGHVNIIETTPSTIKEWKGPHDFFWRVKIKAIQHVASLYMGSPVMYLDTDTFLYNDIVPLKTALLNGKAYMHEDEGALSSLTDKTSKRTWRALKQKTFAGLLMKPTDHMWNAGVVSSPNNQNGKDIELALQICDEMCAGGVPNRLVEQYALSLALHHIYTVSEATPWIAHYWRNKEDWNPFILEWVAEQQFKQKPFTEIIAAFADLDISKVPVIIKRKYTAVKWHRAVDKLFPPTNHQYVKNGKITP
jgi:hypothetical protein